MHTDQTNQDLKATLETKLQPFAQQVVESYGLAGLAIGIVKSGELVYAQGFGVRNRDTGEPVTPRSLFHMASVSKPFVATAIVQLVEQGKIALDAPVVTYLPYFRLKDLSPRFSDLPPISCSETIWISSRMLQFDQEPKNEELEG